LGDWIWETDNGRPLGMSTVRLSRRDSRLDVDDECLSREVECFEDRSFLSEDEECFDELVLEDDLWEDFSDGTSKMFRMRPVVGSVVDDWAGSWDTW
jgi:hypothetical protein